MNIKKIHKKYVNELINDDRGRNLCGLPKDFPKNHIVVAISIVFPKNTKKEEINLDEDFGGLELSLSKDEERMWDLRHKYGYSLDAIDYSNNQQNIRTLIMIFSEEKNNMKKYFSLKKELESCWSEEKYQIENYMNG